MKLPTHKQIKYQCDLCKGMFKHIDMDNEKFCYDCSPKSKVHEIK